MKPIYQTCMEKGIQHVATHATDAATGRRGTTPPASSHTPNGKVKHSWEYANVRHQQQQQIKITQSTIPTVVTMPNNKPVAVTTSSTQLSAAQNNNDVAYKKRRKSKKSVPKSKS